MLASEPDDGQGLERDAQSSGDSKAFEGLHVMPSGARYAYGGDGCKHGWEN